MKLETMGYLIEANPRAACLAEMQGVLDDDQRACRWMACLNVHSYVVAKDDAAFDSALRSADWLVPDGIALVWSGRMMGRHIAERITGPDVFEDMMTALNERSGSVFFLGSTEHTLSLISKRLAKDYPNVRLAGTYSPPFKPDYTDAELGEMINAVAESGADVLWVGMTAPKQEKWIAENRHRLPVKYAGAIGAVFDFYSEQLRRSNPTIQKLGLEWVHRLAMQPRRHWRRIAYSIPRYLGYMLLEILRLGENRGGTQRRNE
ncbi:WecB/TagA/CpsF family glycosyltransferase [Rhodobacter sp. NSM]|uniref:WecB/TagA/CpsF family glycosyltransferase n=1 Tax=Rhodobacter sp. NSM TaxID=3457501 RepID=UPI003FCF8B59